MKILFVIYLSFFSAGLWATSGKEVWQDADRKDQVRLLNQYREFFGEWHEQNAKTLSEFKTSSRFSFFMSKAWATGQMNCIYAGWPSKRVNNFCSSPQRNNPDYNQGPCTSSQMQCQPLLFGKGSCVSVASQKERNLAFTNCDKQFYANKKTVTDLVNEIKAEGKENELFELMDFADNICQNGAQAGTGMCTRLQSALERIKTNNLSRDSIIEEPKIEVENKNNKSVVLPVKGVLVDTIEKVTKIVDKDTPSFPIVDICEPEVAGLPFKRSSPREGKIKHATCRTGNAPYWEDNFKQFEDESSLRPNGFSLRNKGPNSIADGIPTEPSQRVTREWDFVSEDNSRQETYLWITDDSGSGKFSHLMESIIMIIPRKVIPTVEVVGQDLHVTLTTGEKIIYDKDTRIIKGGVMSEGKVDMNPDRFQKKPAPIKYSGTGISIRVDTRGSDPRLIPGNATVTQDGKSCQVPAKELWDSEAKFKYADDSRLINFLNSKCGNNFSL